MLIQYNIMQYTSIKIMQNNIIQCTVLNGPIKFYYKNTRNLNCYNSPTLCIQHASFSEVFFFFHQFFSVPLTAISFPVLYNICYYILKHLLVKWPFILSIPYNNNQWPNWIHKSEIRTTMGRSLTWIKPQYLGTVYIYITDIYIRYHLDNVCQHSSIRLSRIIVIIRVVDNTECLRR